MGRAERGLSEHCGVLNRWTWSPKIRQADRITWGHYKTKSIRTYGRVLWRDRAVASPWRVCRRPPRRQPSWPFKGASNATEIEHQQPHSILALTRSSKDSQKSKTEGCSSHRLYFSELLLPGVKSTDTASQSLGATPKVNGTELGGHTCYLSVWANAVSETGWSVNSVIHLWFRPSSLFPVVCSVLFKGPNVQESWAQPPSLLLLSAKLDEQNVTSAFKYLPPHG